MHLKLAATICLGLMTPHLPAAQGVLEDTVVIGVIHSTEDGKSLALLKVDGSLQPKKVGDKVKDFDIIRMTPRHVVFRGKKRDFLLEIGADRAVEIKKGPEEIRTLVISDGFERQGSNVRITAALKESLVGDNLATVLMQAGTMPRFDGSGNIIGFSIHKIDKGSIYDKVGLEDGDVITHVNGIALNDVSGAIKTLRSLKGADQLELEYIDNSGTNRSLSVSVD